MIAAELTRNGESLVLILAEPDWGSDVEVEESCETSIETTRLGAEYRRPDRDKPVIASVSYAATLEDEDWQSWRGVQRFVGSRRVVCPIWPDVLAAAEWGTRVHESDLVAGWNEGFADPVLGTAESLPDRAYLAPVCVGRLKLNDDEPLCGDLASVKVVVTHDAAPDVISLLFTVSGPVGGAFRSGVSVRLSVNVNGSGENTYTFVWFRDGEEMEGETSKDLVFAMGAAAAGLYKCIVSNGYRSVESKEVAITLATAPVITSQPQSIFGATVGSAVALSVSATGAENYQWQFSSGGGWSGIIGETGTSLSKASLAAGDYGSYRVVVTGPGGTTISQTARITRYSAAPVLRNLTSDLSAAVGDSVTLSVVAENAESIQWYFSTSPIRGAAISGATQSTLAMPKLSENAFGYYCLVASNDYGATTSGLVNVMKLPSVDANVQLLMQVVGGRIVDKCGGTVTPMGNVAVSYNVARSSAGSIYINPASGSLLDYVDVVPAAGRSLNFGLGDFTIESWIYPFSISDDSNFIAGASEVIRFLVQFWGGNFRFATKRPSSAWTNYEISEQKWSGSWRHVAITRRAGRTHAWINDQVVADFGMDFAQVVFDFGSLRLGRSWELDNHSTKCCLDEVRMTNTARYIA